MTTGIIIVAFIIILILSLVYSVTSHSTERDLIQEEVEKRKNELKDFSATTEVYGIDKRYFFGVDDSNQTVLYAAKGITKLMKYSDIMSVELIEDNDIVVSRSLSRTVGGAVVGGVLAGGAGSVVGGLSGNQKSKKQISFVRVKITLRDISNPAVCIDCFNKDTMTFSGEPIKSDSYYYELATEHANKIVDLIKIIIDKTEQERSSSQYESSNSNSIADELAKLAELKEKGILSDEEFSCQKSKLLS